MSFYKSTAMQVPLPVTFTPAYGTECIQAFDEANSVTTSSETEIISYTVPSGKSFYLERISLSGDNIAKYNVKINGTTKDVIRTHHGSGLSCAIDFFSSEANGPKMLEGDILSVTVIHLRPNSGDFNARIQGTLKTL